MFIDSLTQEAQDVVRPLIKEPSAEELLTEVKGQINDAQNKKNVIMQQVTTEVTAIDSELEKLGRVAAELESKVPSPDAGQAPVA
jgi:hypothetical protein